MQYFEQCYTVCQGQYSSSQPCNVIFFCVDGHSNLLSPFLYPLKSKTLVKSCPPPPPPRLGSPRKQRFLRAHLRIQPDRRVTSNTNDICHGSSHKKTPTRLTCEQLCLNTHISLTLFMNNSHSLKLQSQSCPRFVHSC